jgi:2-C-methyl-D-erythritol 2,4-cyclodiphosphate synthase
MYRIGQGFDVHKLVKGRKLILGGKEIPDDYGLLGHSDADVLIHAVCDALLGAASLGDIGTHFPDNDQKYKDANSCNLLSKVVQIILDKGLRIGNIDCTISLQQPKIAEYIPQMRSNISEILGVPFNDVSIKATTTEHLGFIGRGEGIAVWAVALLYTDS